MIDKNPGTNPVEAELRAIAETPDALSEEEIAETERRIGEAVEVIRSEFVLVAKGLDELGAAKLDEKTFPKVVLIGERIGAIAQISPDLAARPDIREKFDEAVRYLAAHFVHIASVKLETAELPESKKAELENLLQKINASMGSLEK